MRRLVRDRWIRRSVEEGERGRRLEEGERGHQPGEGECGGLGEEGECGGLGEEGGDGSRPTAHLSDGYPHSRGGNGDRGQTFPDFAIAIGIFLLTIAFVVAFVPQMTAPYEDQASPGVAERVGADLTGHLLADAGSASQLDESCTIAFFEGTESAACGLDAEATLTEQLGVSDRYAVNVTLRENASDGPNAAVLCSDGGTIDRCGSDRLERGPAVPEDGRSVATARKVVHVDDTYAVLEVRVWT